MENNLNDNMNKSEHNSIKKEKYIIKKEISKKLKNQQKIFDLTEQLKYLEIKNEKIKLLIQLIEIIEEIKEKDEKEIKNEIDKTIRLLYSLVVNIINE